MYSAGKQYLFDVRKYSAPMTKIYKKGSDQLKKSEGYQLVILNNFDGILHAHFSMSGDNFKVHFMFF